MNCMSCRFSVEEIDGKRKTEPTQNAKERVE